MFRRMRRRAKNTYLTIFREDEEKGKEFTFNNVQEMMRQAKSPLLL